MKTAPRLSIDFLAVGECRHCERITLRGGSLRPATFPSICALITHPSEGAILYDTGYSPRFIEATRPFPERLYRWVTPVRLAESQHLQRQLANRGLRIDDIRICLISHFHADHIGGLRDLPRARFFALRADVVAFAASGRVASLMKGFLPALLPDDFPARLSFADDRPLLSLGKAWSGFGGGFDLFGDGSLLAIPLPGHAAGHMGLLLRDQDDREVFLCADACWSERAWRELRYPSCLARPVMHDWPRYRETLQKLHRLGTDHAELAILPSHCLASLNAYRAGLPALRAC